MRSKLKNNQGDHPKALYTVEDHPHSPHLSANREELKGVITHDNQEVVYTPGKSK